MSDTKFCRNCKTPITVSSTGYAEVVSIHKEAKWNFYGEWVCSERCDRQACLDLKSTMPGAGRATSLNVSEIQSIKNNWYNG